MKKNSSYFKKESPSVANVKNQQKINKNLNSGKSFKCIHRGSKVDEKTGEIYFDFLD